jgi:hypothetical protein
MPPRTVAQRGGLQSATSAIAPDIYLPPEVRDNTLFDWVRYEVMFVDMTYARPHNQRKVDALRAEWEPAAIGTLLVSLRRDGRFAVIDGQHRMAAGVEEGMREFPCRVYIDLNVEDEARLYRKFGTVHAQTALDLFKSRLAEGGSSDTGRIANEIQSAVESLGLRLSFRGRGPGNIQAVTALEKTYRRMGRDGLIAVITILKEAWDDDPAAFSMVSITGMTQFMLRYRKLINVSTLVRRLSKLEPLDVLSEARKSAKNLRLDTGTTWGQKVREIYNHKLPLHHRLPEWQDVVLSPGGQVSYTAERAQKGWSTRRVKQRTALRGEL